MNNLGGKFLKDYNGEANCNHKPGLTEQHTEYLWKFPLPVLFAQASGGPKIFIVKVSMTNFFLIKSGM